MARRRWRIFVLAWKAFCYALGTVVLAVVAIQLWFLSHIIYWSSYNPSSTAFMERHLEKPGARLRHTWVPYSRISEHLKRAVHRFRFVSRNLKHVYRFVKTRVGVQVRAETHS